LIKIGSTISVGDVDGDGFDEERQQVIRISFRPTIEMQTAKASR
jgi:hypothetical protein